MANVVLPVAGGTVGFLIGGPVGALIGANLGALGARGFAKSQRVHLPTVEGPRLADLRAQTSTYGNVIPRVYGTMRLAGNVIWSTDIKEVKHEHTTTQGGGGGKFNRSPRVSQTSISYSYYVTLAIAICEGAIDEIIRVWADSKCLTEDILAAGKGKYNVHLGDEIQQPDDIIAKYKLAGTFPAYRGLAYVLIEDFPLADFGNRIPNFTFEVRRSVRFIPSVEDKIKEIVMIPGSGEFVYSTSVCTKQEVIKLPNKEIPYKGKKAINMHNYEGKPDVVLALDQLQRVLPNLEWVALVVTWFATSTDAGKCEIVPKVEFHGNTKIYPQEWRVTSYTRESAREVLRFDKETPTYGGTPSDNTILEIIAELERRNLKVMLYPMIFVDQIAPEAKPWRGRIKPNSLSDIDSWFNKSNGYNRFILHYANLAKGKIDAFVIGSELVGLTSFTDKLGNYPAINNLVRLAAKIKNILGSETKITYAADWSEYHHTVGGWYNLDPLWSSPNIDFVGIDSYFPLTEDLPQDQITEDKIKAAWESSEGWDYYCDSNRQKEPFNGYNYAWKNLEHWWNSKHTNPDGKPTQWNPRMKPVWFTELGFPSVDGCANQPNVFYDPSSKESYFPRGSRARINFQAQREALNASLDYLQARNKTEGKADLVPKSFVWCWDARPFSFWPDLDGVWKDSKLWATGHWVNGKLGNSTLGAIVGELLELSGLEKQDFDVTRLTDTVEGYIINQGMTVRAAIEQLQAAYFFDIVETDGILKCVPRGKVLSDIAVSQDDLIPNNKNGIADIIEIVRAQELELPRTVNVSYIDRPFNYDPVNQSSQRQTVKAVEQVMLNLPLVMSSTQAKKIADVTLYGAWKERVSCYFILPPKYAKLEPTDFISIETDSAVHQMRIVKTDIERNGLMRVAAVSEDISSYDFDSSTNKTNSKTQIPELVTETKIEILDLPPLSDDISNNQALIKIAVCGNGDNWNGAAIYVATSNEKEFVPLTGISDSATMGVTISDLKPGISVTFDESNTVDVILFSGELYNVTESSILNGANLALIGDELIQFQNAELIGDSKYRLSKLLRGRYGTESKIEHHESGTRFVLITPCLFSYNIPSNMIGRTISFKAVSYGQQLEEVAENEFTIQGNYLKPLSPVHIVGNRDDNGNLTIRWIRRARFDNDWRDFVDVPLDESLEKYIMEVLDEPGEIIRVIETSTTTATYSAAVQIADFKEIPKTITVRIYQLSSLVGRGYLAIIRI